MFLFRPILRIRGPAPLSRPPASALPPPTHFQRNARGQRTLDGGRVQRILLGTDHPLRFGCGLYVINGTMRYSSAHCGSICPTLRHTFATLRLAQASRSAPGAWAGRSGVAQGGAERGTVGLVRLGLRCGDSEVDRGVSNMPRILK